MQEIRTLAAEIIANLSGMDIKASPNNLNRSLAIHNCVTRINNIIDTQKEIKATEIPTDAQNEKKVDKK